MSLIPQTYTLTKNGCRHVVCLCPSRHTLCRGANRQKQQKKMQVLRMKHAHGTHACAEEKWDMTHKGLLPVFSVKCYPHTPESFDNPCIPQRRTPPTGVPTPATPTRPLPRRPCGSPAAGRAIKKKKKATSRGTSCYCGDHWQKPRQMIIHSRASPVSVLRERIC